MLNETMTVVVAKGRRRRRGGAGRSVAQARAGQPCEVHGIARCTICIDQPKPKPGSAFQATANVPGYLPDDTEQHQFDTACEAWDWLCREQQRYEDSWDPIGGAFGCGSAFGYSQVVLTLGALGLEANWNRDPDQVKDWLVANGLATDGTGTVLLPLGGLAYSVTEVQR